MNKLIPKDISVELVNFIKNSGFYNKVQILFEFSDSGNNTETFYYFENKWGHSIFKELKEGGTETIKEMEQFDNEDSLVARLLSLPIDAKIIVAGNSAQNIISINL